MRRALRSIEPGVWMPGIAWGVFVYGVHKYGALSGWYFAYPWFQNVTHAASASGVALLVGLVGLELGYRRRRLLLFVVGLTALAAFGWELVEYFGWLDRFGVYLMFHDFNDAAVDMASNAVGTATALVVLWLWTELAPAADRETGANGRELPLGGRLRRWHEENR